MAGTDIADTLLTAGQNEGIERAVLPAPQLSSVINMRMRKASRWGKRFGHVALSSTNLGTGTGLNRAVGGGKGGALTCFALVDDRCSVYDQTASAFVAQSAVPVIGPKFRVAGAASGWLPDTSFFPVPPQTLKNQTTTPCATCYAFGYLWTVIQYVGLGDNQLRLVATDPNDQTVVRVDDFTGTTLGFGGNRYPKLMLVGSTLILTYALSLAATTGIYGRSLTGIGAVWGAETILVGPTAGFAAYDASVYSTTRFAVALAAAPGSIVSLFTTAFAGAGAQVIADVSGNPLTEVSVVGSSTVAAGEIYVGYACAATPSSKVRVFTANLAGTVGTATLTGLAKKPLLGLLPAGGVRAVYASVVGAGTFGQFQVRDVTAAAVAAGNQLTQTCAYPIANPLVIGTNVYQWAKTETSGLSYATLLRLPDPSLFSASGSTSCPIEMSVQDYLVTAGQTGLIELDLRGVPSVAQIGTTAAYAVPVPTLYTVMSTIATGNDFRILQAKHFTDAGSRRSVQAMYADLSSFLPLGALTRVDDRGAIEEGFVHAPTITGIVPAAGAGALTPSSDYYYTAVYKSRNSNGRLEVSAPAAPVKVSMAAGQNQNTVTVLGLGMSARANTTIEIYRTLSNGQTFFLDSIIDSPAAGIGITDQLADTAISTQQSLYTQVGQTLPNAFPPPSRFGCVGGQRLFLGGQMRSDIVQASKLIFGDQSPSFCDNDAFRIVLPAPVTGLAWMDALVMFTSEGVYITSGDGPDDSGVGDFGNITRMPYEVGCIEPRSVIVVDEGCFFQTSRGLYLLPRGFGVPAPAGDAVQDSLATYPIITGCTTLIKTTEQSVHWTCTDASGEGGIRIVYDLAHKAWSIDTMVYGPCGTGQWSGNEVVFFGDSLASAHDFGLTTSGFSDRGGNAISMAIVTGDLRPFGVVSEGVISKLQVLALLRSANTMNVQASTEWGNGGFSRVFALAAGDYQVGDLTTTEVNLNSTSLRSAQSVRALISESSTTEGFALVAITLEHEQGEGLKRVSVPSRAT